MFDLSERVTIITGAVGNVGRAVADCFRDLGAKLVLLDRTDDRLRGAYPDLVNSEGHLLIGNVDLSEPESAADAVATTLRRFGRIDALVNTIGAFRGGALTHEQTMEDWLALWSANIASTLNACRAVVPAMVRQKCGCIVNIASRAALHGEPGLSAYSASKAAVVRLSESMAAELKPWSINVNCVLPGTLDTPQNRAAMPGVDSTTWIQPADLARVIAFLVCDAARPLSGQAICL